VDTSRTQFIEALKIYKSDFGLALSDQKIERLSDFYELIQNHNEILHLVAPCSPEEFATRHVLESLTLLQHLPANAEFADVGAGAGLPSIPCLIVRDDLKATLIESKEKKARFLEQAIDKLGLTSRAKVVNKQFEEADLGSASSVTCRALDKFTEKLPRLLRWAGNSELLFFGGPRLKEKLKENRVEFRDQLMPLSEQRYLFIGRRRG
jgi:16S rRNA (guanine527-N7)-methyltransferase